MPVLKLKVELEREAKSGRWLADIVTIPGVMVYAPTKGEAIRKAQALALEVIADRLANGEDPLSGHPRKAPRLLERVEFAAAG
jgi:hypothetical protein